MGIWIRSGTVSVENGSDIVTGELTTFGVDGAPGNPITINGSRWYEILELDATTPNIKLRLSELWQEATVVNGTYAIIPFLGDRTPMAVNILKQQAALVAGQTDVIETVGAPDPTIAATNVTGKLIAFDTTNRAYYYTKDGVWNGPVSLGGADGADAGFKTVFSNLTATNADPGNGKFRLNNATLAAVTQIALDDASADLGNPDISAYVASWVASTSAVKGTIIVRDVAQPNVFATFALASLTDQSGYTQLNVTLIASHGAFTDGHTFSVAFIGNGDKGDTGTAGVNAGFTMSLDRSTTAMAEPGTAKVRFDNASFASTNNIAMDDQSAETGNPSVAASIAAWAASTNAVKGKLHIRKVGAPQNFAIFDVMSVTPQTGWTEIGVAFEVTGGALANNDVCTFVFVPAGDEGTDGVDGTSAGFAFTFDTTIGMADPGAGKIRFDNATLSAVENIAIDDQSSASGNPDVSASILSWDASTNANMRGTLRVTKKGHEEVYAEFAINGGTVDNVGWSKLAVSLISSAGAFANGDAVYVSATRAGDKGLDGDGAGDVIGPAGASDGNIAAFDTSTGKRIKDTGVSISTDPTFAANSDNLLPTQAAVGTYVNTQIAAQIAASDVEVLKGGLDCSGNPNYPAADAGHVYRVTVAGKIGGAAGVNVEIGDRLECFVDGSASGTHASVGGNWIISQVNIDGAVVGPASSTTGNLAAFSGASGKVIQDTGIPSASLRKKLVAATTFYVGAALAAPAFTAGSANVGIAAHGLSLNDPVCISVPLNRRAATVAIASPGVWTLNNHGFSAGRPVRFISTGALPTGYTAGTTYYVIASGLTTNAFQVAATPGGTAINATGTQSGTHYCETVGALPTFSVAGTLVDGQPYYVKTIVDANTVTLSSTPGGTAIGTATLATGSPVYNARTGNDLNDGGAATRSRALLTIAGGIGYVASKIDAAGYGVTVQLADGTYNESAQFNQQIVGAGNNGACLLQGNTTTPDNVRLMGSSAPTLFSIGMANDWKVDGVRVKNSSTYCIEGHAGSWLRLGKVVIDSSGNGVLVAADNRGTVEMMGDVVVVAGGVSAFYSDTMGYLLALGGTTVTFVGTPAFSAATVLLSGFSMQQWTGSTIVGAATGQRYSINYNSVLATGTANVNFFPGDVAGSAGATGGRYN